MFRISQFTGFVAVFLMTTGFALASAPSVFAATTLEVGGYKDFFFLDRVERVDTGRLTRTLTESFTVPQFDSSLGTLTQVEVRIHGGDTTLADSNGSAAGVVEYGVSPKGPTFLGGAGTVSARATLLVEMRLPTSSSVRGFAAASGTHTGSIAGPPGAGSRSTSDLRLNVSSRATFTSASDLALFQGLGDITFRNRLTMAGDATVEVPGPSFEISPSLIPGIGGEAHVIYTYQAVPSPAAAFGAVVMLGALGLRRRRRPA